MINKLFPKEFYDEFNKHINEIDKNLKDFLHKYSLETFCDAPHFKLLPEEFIFFGKLREKILNFLYTHFFNSEMATDFNLKEKTTLIKYLPRIWDEWDCGFTSDDPSDNPEIEFRYIAKPYIDDLKLLLDFILSKSEDLIAIDESKLEELKKMAIDFNEIYQKLTFGYPEIFKEGMSKRWN